MATEKQKKAIGLLVENGGNVSKSMREAGYSPKTAKTPKKLTESDAFKAFADSLPDEMLLEVHLEGLKAEKKVFKNNVTSGEIEEVAAEPDHAVRHKYLDSAYKIKGAYATEKVDVTTKGEKVNIDDNQFTQLIAAAHARAASGGSSA